MSHAIRANVTHNMRMVLDEARESNHKHTSGTRLPKPLNCVAPFDRRGVFDAFEQKLLFFCETNLCGVDAKARARRAQILLDDRM